MSDRLHLLPKAELHVHLDGSLRAETLWELARERDVHLPARDASALADYMVVSDATSLEEYLERFDVTLSVLQDADALERTAYELVHDHAAENVRYVEVRFCPLLNTKGGLGADDVLDAVLAGLRRAQAEADVTAQVIVCALRTLDPTTSVFMADLAVAYRDRGVCGFDIAGAESGYPVADHAEAFERASRAGLPITIHAGEGHGPESIRQAVELGHARRIGHGTRLGEDPELLDEVRRREILLEVCLTSNVQTGVARSFADHPARRYLQAGVPVSLCTDNRLMSGVTLSDEFGHAERDLGMTRRELCRVARSGFEHAFASHEVKERMLRHFDAAAESLPLTMDEGP